MSMYQPGIPTGTVELDVDYQNLQNNFQQLDTTYGHDHFKFSDGTANNGKHQFVTMPIENLPASSLKDFVLFNTNLIVSDPSQLFYTRDNSGIAYPITGKNDPVTGATNGSTALIGNIVVQWGKISQPNAASGQVSFNTSFLTHVYGVFFTLARNASSADNMWINTAGTNDLTQFGWKSSTSLSNVGDFFFWYAIGN